MNILSRLPFPSKEQITAQWVIFLLFGTLVGFQLREAVVGANPGNALVALDWGILFGAGIYYGLKMVG
jgi:hypothetical protein